MTANNSLFRSFGALELPLADSVATDLSALNPGRAILLELLADALVAELSPVWTAAVAGTPLAGTTPVTQRLPEVPDLATVEQVATVFPLLAVGETADAQTIEDVSIWQSRLTRRWEVDYMLGPLEIGNQFKLQDVLGAAFKIIVETVGVGGHLAHETSTSPTSNQIFPKQVLGEGDGCAGFSSVRVVEGRVGSAGLSEGGPKYHALTLIVETTELDRPTPGAYASYGGASIEVRTGTTEGQVSMVRADTAIPLKP